MTTREVVNGKSVLQNLEFADYGFHGDSCRDYARLVTNGAPYHSARDQYQKDRDLPALIAAVARAYATDPNCAHLATVIASQRNVKQAVAEANRQESTRAPNQAQSDTSARRSEHINKTCRERASGTQECGGDVPDFLWHPSQLVSAVGGLSRDPGTPPPFLRYRVRPFAPLLLVMFESSALISLC